MAEELNQDQIEEEVITVEATEGSDESEGEFDTDTVLDAIPDEEVSESQDEEHLDKGSSEESEVELGSWFIVQCNTGKEYRVRDRIVEMIEIQGFEDKVQRVLVPEEEVIEIKNNQRQERITKIYPGYIFVQMYAEEEVFYAIRRLTDVAKFMGLKNTPTPVMDEEMLKVLRKVGDKTKKIDIDFEVDEVIKVISGPFRGYSGPISGINSERGKLKTLISIFGRETPVELDFDQVEKVVS